MPLWIAIRLPSLPLESLSPPTDAPSAAFERKGNRRIVLCANALAEEHGIGPGMEVGAATALVPALTTLERKPAAERAALTVLASAAYRFSASVTLRAAAPSPRLHTVWLEVGSSLRLFKGLDPLLEQLRAALDALGYGYRLGLAPTPECASLLAEKGDAHLFPGKSVRHPFSQLRTLPLDLLEVSDEIRDALRGSGLRTIGDALDLPINELAMRFGQPLPDYLGRITGRLPDTRKFFRPPDKYRRCFEFDAELENLEALLFPMRRLLVEFQHYLIGRDTGVQEFSLELEHAGHKPTQMTVGMGAPSRDAAHLLLLLRERFERTPMAAPVRALTLLAKRFAMPRVIQRTLFEDRTAADEEWQSVLNRLRARLGPAAVHSLGLNDDYRPEKSWCRLPPGEVNDRIAESAPRQRPLWLLPEPRPLDRIPDCVSGPERLESGWWDGLDARRDYYQARTAEGARLWVYRDRRSGGWFLQGLWS